MTKPTITIRSQPDRKEAVNSGSSITAGPWSPPISITELSARRLHSFLNRRRGVLLRLDPDVGSETCHRQMHLVKTLVTGVGLTVWDTGGDLASGM